MINQTWLKTFITLADVGHFTQTAERLFMTQSGVSQHIKKLETQLGVDLLIREGKSFRLTQQGRELYQRGSKLLQLATDLNETFKKDSSFEGDVSIMSPGSIGLKLYPQLLSLQERYPQLCFSHHFASNSGIEQALANHALDIGIMTKVPEHKHIASKELTQEPIVLVTPKYIKNVSWPNLLDLGFIHHPDAEHHAKLLLTKNFDEFEHTSQFIDCGSSNQITLILEPVARGFGFTVLPLYAVQAFKRHQDIHVHPLKNKAYEHAYLCYNRMANQSARVKMVNKFLNSLF
ncbi:LysR family transcriptional regulator [Thalassotalea euphylliae]|uniref:LysR family transcriptional regulator n=1 Tax=Thalassotalea euphylliae TaxID=1655234 RepID=UPI0036294E61